MRDFGHFHHSMLLHSRKCPLKSESRVEYLFSLASMNREERLPTAKSQATISATFYFLQAVEACPLSNFKVLAKAGGLIANLLRCGQAKRTDPAHASSRAAAAIASKGAS